jgi:methionine-rich copper-binding protein CopC
MTMRSVLLLVAALSLSMDNDAQAHAFLVKADPAVGSALTGKPTALRLEFSEAIELGFSGVELTAVSGTALALNGVRFADDGHKVLIASLPMLTSGTYRVKWHVVSVDTHRTEGAFTFTLKP